MSRITAALDPGARAWRNPLRRAARTVIELQLHAIAWLVMFLARLRAPGMGLGLVYHRVGPERGDPAREILPAISSRDFRAHMRLVARHYQPVHAGALRKAAAERRRGSRLPVAVTFDDDHLTHLTVAAPILRASGATATFFLCGASLEQPRTFWWERLQAVADTGTLATTEFPGLASPHRTAQGGIHRLALAIEKMTPADREAVSRALLKAIGDEPTDAGLRAAQVRELADQGFEIGFHTREHHPLPTLDDPDLDRALRDGRPELEAAVGAKVRTIAYPHGQVDPRVPQAVRSAGFEFGFVTRGASMRPEDDRALLPRFEGPSVSPGVFALKLATAPWRRSR